MAFKMNAIFYSAAHLFGTRPFDKTIYPVESWFVSALAAGEGWHNYHVRINFFINYYKRFVLIDAFKE